MILYDQNYNFLGISGETVNFLGYEDIKEFLSVHNDFANLLVQKEGKIYKFKNLSWIDFILYSGSQNKLATVTLKNGDEIDIKLTVKEIIFAKELGGFEKCYAVRIISDKFVNIASKVNENMKFEVNNSVSLTNLLTEQQPALKEESIENYADSSDIEDEDTTKTTFNFPSADELRVDMYDVSEEESTDEVEEEKIEFDFPTADELNSDVDEGIKLDFTADDIEDEEVDYTDDDKDITPQATQKLYEDELGIQAEEESYVDDFGITPQIESELMPVESELMPESKELEIKEDKPSANKNIFNLDFLKRVDNEDENEVESNIENEVESNIESEVESNIENEVESNIENEVESIIENEVDEIQTQEDPIEDDLPQVSNLNFLKKHISEDDEILDTTVDVGQDRQEIIEQIKNDIDEIDEKESIVAEINEDVVKESFIDDEKEDIVKENNVKEDVVATASTMSAGSFVRNMFKDRTSDVKPTDEFEDPELMLDFINESISNISQLKSFVYDENYKNALYPIAKMNASADILNLNDIISSLNSIKSSAQSEEKESILNNINLLEDKLNILNQNIKQEAAFS